MKNAVIVYCVLTLAVIAPLAAQTGFKTEPDGGGVTITSRAGRSGDVRIPGTTL
jgi:hypothetical protein